MCRDDTALNPAPRRPFPPQELSLTAVVLAAGASRRFRGHNKLLYVWRGKAVLSHALDRIHESLQQPVLVVTGADRRAVNDLLIRHETRPVVVHNPDWARGMGCSLAVGIRALPRCDAVLVCLGDMPIVEREVVETLVRAAIDTPHKPFVVPVFNGQRGHPVLLRRVLFEQIQELENEPGARSLMADQPELVLEVPVATGTVLCDIDTREDAQQLEPG